MRLPIVGAALASGLIASPVLAADFYVDPQSGSMSGDGSSGSPWRTLQEVIDAGLVESQEWESLPYMAGASLVVKNAGAPVKAGDTIWLRSGDHGELSITGYYNASEITVRAEAGHDPRFSSVLVRGSGGWRFSGLTVSLEFAPTYESKTIFDLDSHGFRGPVRDIVVEDSSLQSVADASGWSATDWDTLAGNGFSVDGTNITIRRNRLRNVNFGISVSATDSLIESNVVDGFAGDGLRGLGDHTVFQYNTVKNCYAVNANHDDGFQSWSVGSDGSVGTGEVVGIVLRGNTILNYEDPNQPFRCTLQGIGNFDGTFVDWVVENNVVITDHWHGITLLGARNSRVVNNTVIDVNQDSPGPPWIRIAPHKNGTASQGCVVRNNLTTSLNLEGGGITEDHNLEVTDLAAMFVDPASNDLHLLPGAPAIDMGAADLAPSIDRDGIPRPQGSEVDIGAYEWHDGSATPVDGGPGSGGAAGAGGGSSGSGTGGSGTAGTSGSSGGSSPGSGGTGTGGTSANADAGDNAASGGSDDSGGCGCRVAGAEGRIPWLLTALALMGVARSRAAGRRRRRESARRRRGFRR